MAYEHPKDGGWLHGESVKAASAPATEAPGCGHAFSLSPDYPGRGLSDLHLRDPSVTAVL